MRSHAPTGPFSERTSDVAVVILAAGRGTRFRSKLPKPLHPVAGLPMVDHVVRAAAGASPRLSIVVTGANDAAVADHLAETGVVIARQENPLGTGDALRAALPAISEDVAWITVLFADHPLLTRETVADLLAGARESGALATVLATAIAEAGTYGRIVRDADGRPRRIVERKDDDPALRRGVTEINSGMMVLRADWARSALKRLTPSAATEEYYLTGLVEQAIADKGEDADRWPVAVVRGEPESALGVNDRQELAHADSLARDRLRRRLMMDGVTLVGAETIFVDVDVEVAADTTILPFSTIGRGTVIGTDCVIGPHAIILKSRIGPGVVVRASTVEASTIAAGADVGPYSHLRGGTEIGTRVHVGNFAELKNARIGEDAKVGHFSYLGDVEVGARTNIGAGTVTANFDGVDKHRTTIGAAAFIGSDTILRAPVRIGDGAATGAGSVVTKDVPDHSLAVGVPARVIRRRSPSGVADPPADLVGHEPAAALPADREPPEDR